MAVEDQIIRNFILAYPPLGLAFVGSRRVVSAVDEPNVSRLGRRDWGEARLAKRDQEPDGRTDGGEN